MRNLSSLVIGVVMLLATFNLSLADEPAPLAVSLRPQMLSLSPRAKIELVCKLTNTSDKPLSVDWSTPQVSMFPRQINVSLSVGSMGKKIELAAGESRALPIIVQLGADLPALDEGDYDLSINLALAAEGTRRHLQEKLPLTIVVRDGAKPATTAKSLVAAAREFALKRAEGDKLDFESYQIRRRGEGWDIDLSLRGPQRFGSMTVSLDANGGIAHVLPIP